MMASNFLAIDIEAIEPEEGAPAPDRLLTGDPKFRTWNVEEAEGGLYARLARLQFTDGAVAAA